MCDTCRAKSRQATAALRAYLEKIKNDPEALAHAERVEKYRKMVAAGKRLFETRDTMSVYVERKSCRVCGDTYLPTVINLGEQKLQGQFPEIDRPDPPAAPLVIVRCLECGLMQTKHTVDPNAQFQNYYYRSSVSQTMRDHLKSLITEAGEMLINSRGARVLDIGGNDGYTLECVPFPTGQRVLIDPSDVPVEYPGIQKIHGFWPDAFMLTIEFDLILSIACFYDADDPVHFAKAVRKTLSPKGLWVVEVADQYAVMQHNAFDYWCFEHVGLYSPYTMSRVAAAAGLKIIRCEPNLCNGGSMRYYLAHQNNDDYASHGKAAEWNEFTTRMLAHGKSLKDDGASFERFASQIKVAKENIVELVTKAVQEGKKVHLLGASTKLNTVLQYCGLDHRLIDAASDRDPRKAGRLVTPGTRIPIVSEEESRRRNPGLYLTVLGMFRKELIKRERDAGNKADICFLLPQPEIVKA